MLKSAYPPSTSAPSEPTRLPQLANLQPQRHNNNNNNGNNGNYNRMEVEVDSRPDSREREREREPRPLPGQAGALVNPFLQPKQPPPIQLKAPAASSIAGTPTLWYPQDSRISESHAAYGAFYHTPSSNNTPHSRPAAAAGPAQWAAAMPNFTPWEVPTPIKVRASGFELQGLSFRV